MTTPPTITISQVLDGSHTGDTVRVCGWVDRVRDQKAVQFIVIGRDGQQLQATNIRAEHPEVASTLSSLTPGSVVAFCGEVVPNERVKLGGIELLVSAVELLSLAEPSPITAETSLDGRLDYRWVDLRRPEARLIFHTVSEVERIMREFFHSRGLVEIHTPKLMSTPSESGADVFEVDYFGGKAYLAQSPQLYKQMAVASALGSVFEIAAAYRAENSNTSRHATEFLSVDVELAFAESVEDVMRFEEDLLCEVLNELQCSPVGDRIEAAFSAGLGLPGPFPRIPLAQAGEMLAGAGHQLRGKGDLDPEGERLLCKLVAEQYGSEFVFVTEWPASLRPFYHMRDGDSTRSFDLLWRGVEITTGAQREHRHQVLTAQAAQAKLGSSVDFYLDFFRYGCPPHGGFGFGLARFIMMLLHQDSIRETTLLHRSPRRLTP